MRQETQRDLKRLAGARSIELDVWAIDEDGREYDLEVQTGSEARPMRVRYHGSAMDVEALDAGQRFEALSQRWVVFVMEQDPFGMGRPTYHFVNYDQDAQIAMGDGAHIVYANGQFRGEDAVGKLLHDFCESDPDLMQDSLMAERVRYFKSDKTEVGRMASVIDELLEREREEGRAEGRKEGRKEGRREGREGNLIENVRTLVRRRGYEPEGALDLLCVPESEWPRYLAKL